MEPWISVNSDQPGQSNSSEFPADHRLAPGLHVSALEFPTQSGEYNDLAKFDDVVERASHR